MRNKWLLLAAALPMLAITWLDNDFSALKGLTFGDMAPVILITGVAFLMKTGILALVLTASKKLLEKLTHK